VAFVRWDPLTEREPEGWIRSKPSHRRRIYIFDETGNRRGHFEYVHV
jgi:hypothetical protein